MKQCKKCGSTEFYKNGDCKPCSLIRNKKWAEKNKEKLKQYNKEYREKNKEIIKIKNKEKYEKNSEKIKQIAKEWYANNKDIVKERSKQWRKNNPEKTRIYKRKERSENPEKFRIKTAKWRKENPELTRIYKQNRRARESNGKITKVRIKELFKLQKNKCICCGNQLNNDYHVDHVMPLALGGTNTDDNIQLLCPSCNIKKQAKHPIDFMQSLGFLL